MASSVNKPTGLGYQGDQLFRRVCTLCFHLESTHYGSRCHASLSRRGGFDYCPCVGFSARELDETEKSVLEAGRIESELEYVGEALYTEIRREASK